MREKIGFNAESLTFDGRAWYPIMGEMHYSRTNRGDWHRSLSRLAAGGVDIVSGYVIWIHHEEIEGEYDFSGNRDLRSFLLAAADCGLYAIIRIGPWVHAEVRNGGFPDWLLHKGFEPRSNDEEYFRHVRRFYTKIFEQVGGLFYGQGGPIIGVQIENEYGHCGGMGGQAGQQHMRRLANMAKEIGFDVPLYTATGWGGAVTGGMLPVMGAYCDAPWDERTEKLPPNPNYLISLERNDKNIGSDMGLGYGLTFDTADYPYLMAELGGGLNSTHHRRLSVSPRDTAAMSLCKIAGGCNLLGYYMYHGGVNPRGKLTTLQESRESGSLNDMPVLGYDGGAPITQYGCVGGAYKEIKLLTMFLHSFGERLCGMKPIIPPDNPKKADDLNRLRYCVREKDGSGFLFVNNYVRGYSTVPHENVSLKLGSADFTGLNVAAGDFFFYPYNMPLGGALLKSAHATPLCLIDGVGVFYTDGEPNYEFEGRAPKVITLTRRQALDAFRLEGDRQYLALCGGTIAKLGGQYVITDSADCRLATYPALPYIPEGFERLADEGEFALYRAEREEKQVTCRAECARKDGCLVCELELDYNGSAADEIELTVSYDADRLELYAGGELVNDEFYNGEGFCAELRALGSPARLTVKLYPALEGDKVYYENPPRFVGGRACALRGVSVKQSYYYGIGGLAK